MPKVNFKVNFFGPDAKLYRTTQNPHEVDDDFRLPPRTEVLNADNIVTGIIDDAGEVVSVAKPAAPAKK